MADNRTMAQMLQAPIEGYEDAIVVPPINANNFELKQTLINLVQSNQFTGRQDPHNHLRFFNKVTSTFRHPKVPNTTVKLLLFPFSLEGEARIWLDKEPLRSILTWEDLVSKFINQFFPPFKTTYLRNEITNFLQKSNETFNEAWEHFKDLLRQCPHHGFSELHQLDTFYNALNPNDQDALDSAAGGNFLDKIPREGIDSESEEIKDFLNDDSIQFGVEDSPFNMDKDILFLESLLRDDPIPPHPIIPNQTKLPIEETNHSLKMGYEHFNTNLPTKDVAEPSTKNFIPIPNECIVVLENGSRSIEPINNDSSNLLSDESTVKSDYFDEFYGPFIPIHILEEERTRREHADHIKRMEMLFTINQKIDVVSDDVLPPSNDSDDEVDVDGDLRVDNVIQNFEHKYSEIEKNLIVKFECIDARMKFDAENDVFKIIMFSLLSAESEDTIFDPGISK
nr:reverse transcriptase domain-containing protein [Tanacetum cinerariifolium]